MMNVIRYIGTYLTRLVMHILSFVPVKKNRIVFNSFCGLQYSCNPKYISEGLEKAYPGEFEIIWLLERPQQYTNVLDKHFKIARATRINRMRYLLTANVSVINAGNIYASAPLRHGQLHINTWHGGGYYKQVGLDESEKTSLEKSLTKLSSKNTSQFVSSSKCFTENVIRRSFAYDGEVLDVGYPRNDIFFNGDRDEIRGKVFAYFGIDIACKITIYAPTYRYENTEEQPIPDFEILKATASKRFGGKWVVLFRTHFLSPITADQDDVYDATYRPDMPDMQELLMASDMLITDYSSSIWDFSFTGRPCLLYTPDLDTYTASRGFGLDIYEWGFPVCRTEQELFDAIGSFDLAAYQTSMQQHHIALGSYEDGHATEKICRIIHEHCFGMADPK